MEAASSYPQVSHVNYNIFIEYIELVIKLLEKKTPTSVSRQLQYLPLNILN